MTIERIEIVLPIQGRTGTIMAQRVDASGRYIDPIDLQLGFDGSELPQEVQDALASINAQQQATIATLTAERDSLNQQLSAMTTERDDALSEKASLQTQLDSANERVSTLESRIVELTAEPEVPIVSRRQARLALLQMNLLERIEASLAQSSKAVQIEYEADAWRRDNPTLVAMAEQLGMDAEQIDQFFALAGTL
jgi:chromosome segregation ATPase